MRHIKSLRYVFLPLFAGICLLGGQSCSGRQKLLEFTVTFKDAKGLQPGQLVVYHGIRVGEVRGVDLDPAGRVTVSSRIDAQHRTKLYREAEYVIEKPGGVMDMGGTRQLTVKDRNRPRTQIEPGDVLEGSEGWMDHTLGQIEDLTSVLGELGQELWDEAKTYAASPEGQALLESLGEMAEKAKQMGEEQFRQFMENSYPELEKEALDLKDKLEEEGRFEDAQKFWKKFQEWWGSTSSNEVENGSQG